MSDRVSISRGRARPLPGACFVLAVLAALGHEIPIGHQIEGQIPIDLLVDLGEVVTGGGQADERVDEPHGGDEHHQTKGELCVQRPNHGSPRVSANLYPTPHTVRM